MFGVWKMAKIKYISNEHDKHGKTKEPNCKKTLDTTHRPNNPETDRGQSKGTEDSSFSCGREPRKETSQTLRLLKDYAKDIVLNTRDVYGINFYSLRYLKEDSRRSVKQMDELDYGLDYEQEPMQEEFVMAPQPRPAGKRTLAAHCDDVFDNLLVWR